MVVYDEQQLAAARHLARYLPISQILGALSAAHSDCAARALPMAIGSGSKRCTGAQGKVWRWCIGAYAARPSCSVRRALGRAGCEPTRRAQRARGSISTARNHLREPGAEHAVFDGHRVWDIATSEWVERCQRSGAPA